LIQAAAGATVLIHEATFEDDKAEEARAKHHSTTGEAMDVATKVRAGSVG
jgi:ribonuclease Z